MPSATPNNSFAGHRVGNLEELARNKFLKLSAAEERVVRAASEGTITDCRDLGGGDEPGKANGTPEASDVKWPDACSVRADLIRWLCVDREAREQVDPKGVHIRGARISEPLDLSFTNVPFPLVLVGCRLEQNLDLKSAKIPLLSLEGSWTQSIDADGLKSDGDVFMRDGFHAEGEVRLLGATIGGDLSARCGTFKNPNGCALSADRVKVAGSVFLGNGFSAEGSVRLTGATIGGNLDATHGTFKRPSGKALNPDGTENESALNSKRIKVSGSVLLSDGFSAEGKVELDGATIGGDLDASDGTFKSSKSEKGPDTTGNALTADGIKVIGDVLLSDHFITEGEVRLLGAEIGGNLDAGGGRFRNSNGDALSADGIKVRGDMFLNNRFSSAGKVRMLGAEIGGQLEVDDAWLDLLNLDSAHITGLFLWQNIQKEAESDLPNKEWKTSLDLTNAKVGSLADQEAAWPKKGRLRLDGFVYDRITTGPDAKAPTDTKVPTDATARLRWLRRQPDELGFRPQPYEQLIAVLRQMGHEHQVAKVAIDKQWDLRKHGHVGPWGWIQNWLLYLSVGYGYRAWLAFIWLSALVVLGSCVFSRAHTAHVLVPSDQAAYELYENSKMEALPLDYPRFHALLYSLDVVSPFDLGQKSKWRLVETISFWKFEIYSLCQLLAGWALLIVAAAVPAGLIKKD